MTLVPRVLTALVGIPILVAAIWWGFPAITLLVAIAAVLGIRELYALYSAEHPSNLLPLPMGVIWVLAFAFAGQTASGIVGFLSSSAMIFLVGAFISLLWLIAFYNGRRLRAAVGYLVGGPLYIGFLLAHTLTLRDIGSGEDLGRDWLFLALFVAFATDIGAFFVGKSIGRYQLAPSVSPGKTWEGAFGGLITAIITSMSLGLLLTISLPIWQGALIGAAVGLAAQAGDLFESKLKRISHVKDSGSIIPGHGGILDRLDSLLVSIPTVYYLAIGIFGV